MMLTGIHIMCHYHLVMMRLRCHILMLLWLDLHGSNPLVSTSMTKVGATSNTDLSASMSRWNVSLVTIDKTMLS